MEDKEARQRVERVEALLEEIESLPPPAGEKATEVVQALLDLYGEGLARIVERVAADRGALARELAEDELVSHLMLLHDVHPVDLETRVVGALGQVRPYLESHGGNVELLGLEGGVVRLRLQGSCSGCPSSAMTLKLAIEDAIHKAAPDVEAIEAEGAAEEEPGPQLLQLGVSDSLAGASSGTTSSRNGSDGLWVMAGGLSELSEGEVVVKSVSGDPLLFLRLDATFYSYRPRCPGCGRSLEDAPMERAELVCQGCGSHFDVRRAGRCLDAPQLHLEPVPLLVTDDGLIKVALPAPV